MFGSLYGSTELIEHLDVADVSKSEAEDKAKIMIIKKYGNVKDVKIKSVVVNNERTAEIRRLEELEKEEKIREDNLDDYKAYITAVFSYNNEQEINKHLIKTLENRSISNSITFSCDKGIVLDDVKNLAIAKFKKKVSRNYDIHTFGEVKIDYIQKL